MCKLGRRSVHCLQSALAAAPGPKPYRERKRAKRLRDESDVCSMLRYIGRGYRGSRINVTESSSCLIFLAARPKDSDEIISAVIIRER